MKVAEKFISINGEGMRAGEPAVFVRFKGCNLRCTYCDTLWANEPDCEFEDESPEEIYKYIKSSGIDNVTLTGGEPLLQEEMPELLGILSGDNSIRTEIETNGAVEIHSFKKKIFCSMKKKNAGNTQLNTCPVTFTMDYKLPSSGFEHKMIPGNLEIMDKHDTVKFVAGSREDLFRALEIIKKYGLNNKCNVFFSPVFGKIEPREIADFIIKNKLNNTKLQIQIHKVVWDPDARGV